MSIISSTVNTRSQDFIDNATAYHEKVDRLHDLRREQRIGGSEKARKLHVDRGKILPRDRVERLIDPGTPFMEFGELAGLGQYDGVPPGAGIITGIGMIENRP